MCASCPEQVYSLLVSYGVQFGGFYSTVSGLETCSTLAAFPIQAYYLEMVLGGLGRERHPLSVMCFYTNVFSAHISTWVVMSFADSLMSVVAPSLM